MASVNRAILIGNLGRDAEVSYTRSGVCVAKLSVATTERYSTHNGEKKEETQWHRVTVWSKLAEALHEYLKKGKQIYVEGRIQDREHTGKDGVKRYYTDIRADRVTLLGGGKRDEPSSRRDSDARAEPEYDDRGEEPTVDQPSDDDIPF